MIPNTTLSEGIIVFNNIMMTNNFQVYYINTIMQKLAI